MLDDWKTVVSFLNDLVAELDPDRSAAHRAGIYGGAAALLSALKVTVHDAYGADGYALEKISKARWGFAAALGIDNGNGHDIQHLRVLVLGALSSLESQLSMIDERQ